MTRKNGWQLAEQAGEATPDGMQRLLSTASWDPDQVRDDLRGYVVEKLGDPAAVLVVPGQTAFATKPQLARGLLERALDAGVPASWVTADAAYGGDSGLRGWLEQRGMAYVLAVRRTELLAGVDGERVAAEQLAARVPPERWLRISAGQGAKGCRWYDWTQLALQPASTHTGRWLPWYGSPVCAGRLRTASRPPKVRLAWTTTSSVAGPAGTGTPSWRCWPMPSWRSSAPKWPASGPKGAPQPGVSVRLVQPGTRD